MIQRASFWISGLALVAAGINATELHAPSLFDYTATETTATAGMWVSARTPGIGPYLVPQERLLLASYTAPLSSGGERFHADGDHSGHTHNDAFQLDEGKPPEKASISDENSAQRTTDNRMQAKKKENGANLDDSDDEDDDDDEDIATRDVGADSGLFAFALYAKSEEANFHATRTVENLREEISDSNMPRDAKVAAREMLSRAAAQYSDAEYTRRIFKQVGVLLNQSWTSPSPSGQTPLVSLLIPEAA